MPMSISRSFRVVINGKVAGHPLLRPAIEEVRARGRRVEVRVTWESGDAALFAEEAARNGLDGVVAVGGDGTLSEVVDGVCRLPLEQRCAVGVVPLGTANDFAKACGIGAGDPLDGLMLAAEAEPTRIDVGRLGNRRFINVASGGFGAEVTTETPHDWKHLLGRAAYLITGLTQVKNIRAHTLRLEGPDFTWAGRAYVFAVGNGRQAGGGFQVCPRARIDDGLLDVFVLPETPPNQLMRLLRDLLHLRADLPPDAIVYRQLPRLRVTSDEMIQVNLDGEPLRSRSHEFAVEPAALPFFLPPRASSLVAHAG